MLKIKHLTKKVIFFAFFLLKYLVSSKICCTFASAFAQKWGTPKKSKAMIFEKMSIHNKIVVQELK